MKRFEPEGGFIMLWNKILFLCCVLALALDPLFLYIPIVNGAQNCLEMDHSFAIVVCALRSFVDVLFIFHIIIQFRTAYVPRYNHVHDYYVAKRYLTSYFIIDVLASLPLAQIAVLVIIPNLDGATSFSKENLLKFVILSQYVPRVIQTCLFYQKVTTISGFITQKPWAGAAFKFFLYLLVTYVFGALWYLFAIESVMRCWRIACESHNCHSEDLYCGKGRVGDYGFLNMSCPLLEQNEIKDLKNFDFGIFLNALHVLETRDFLHKVLSCSWWGLQTLSSLGQGLNASDSYGEILFAYFITVTGLGLYTSLFGNMQYLQSSPNLSLKMEELEDKNRESEDFMSSMFFPEELRRQVRTHQQYKRKSTRGVEFDSFVGGLPRHIRKDIYRQHYFPLLKKVPIFEQVEEHILYSICGYLKEARHTENSYLLQEGDPADEMLFIRHGEVLITITSGRSSHLRDGDFYGEAIIPWVLNPKRQQLPFSTIKVKALTNVEAFTLAVDDLLSVASRYRLFHNRRLQHISRFYSQQWRTWAAYSIQFGWQRHTKWKHEKILEENKRLHDALATGSETSTISIVASFYMSIFSSSVLRILRRKRRESPYKLEIIIQKPTQPDFDDNVAAPKLQLMRPVGVYL